MRTRRTFIFTLILLVSALSLLAQDKTEEVKLKKDFEIQKHTIMERFETDYMASAQERAELKEKRIADAEFTLSVLDTIKISERKRKLLLRDLKYNPFSDRLTKFIVDSKFEDEEVENQ